MYKRANAVSKPDYVTHFRMWVESGLGAKRACKQLTRATWIKVAVYHTMSTEATTTSRCSLWTDREVKALIAIWGEGNVQEEVDRAVRNKVVFVNIANKMKEQGYNRNWQQCRTKIKNLKKEQKITIVKQGETEKLADSLKN